MATATRASRRRLRSFWRPRAELTRTCCPSKSTHTGVTCGLPSGISVARFPNAGLRKRSRNLSGMRSAIMSSVRNFTPWKASSLYHGRCSFPISVNGAGDALLTLVLQEEVRHPWLRTGHWFRARSLEITTVEGSMHRSWLSLFGGLLLGFSFAAVAHAQAAHRFAIRAGKLIDGTRDRPIVNALILVEGGKIVSVTPGGNAPADAEVIDLSHATVLPGLIDLHTHLLLQGDIAAADYDEQLLKQSIPYRAILAARNARIALEHGFTALRDLETEGAMYADVDVKLAIDRGEIPGPRVFTSTRAMAPTGMYPITSTNWELELPHGVQPVDGVDNARLAVRQQVQHGADWIKYYSDRRYYFTPDSVLHSWVNFTDAEAKAIVDETHRLGRMAAAHAIGSDRVSPAAPARRH